VVENVVCAGAQVSLCVPPGSVMSELIDQYLVHKESSEGSSIETVNKYRRYLLMLSKWLDDVRIDDASRDQLLEFTGSYAHRQLNLTPSARKPLIAAIRGFYAWLAEAGRIDASPADGIKYPRAGRRLPETMQLSNAERLLMQPDLGTFIGIRDLAILSIMVGCGPRVSGVASLNESNLIWSEDDDGLQLFILFREKGGRERLVPAHPDTMWILRAYLGHVDIDAIDRALPDGDRVLFVSVGNRCVPGHEYYGEARRISPRSIDDMIKRYGEQAGIPKRELHAHALRHLFGTELAESDVDLLTRQALLGHADPKTTEIYTHLAMRKLAKASRHASPLSKIHTPIRSLTNLMRDK